MKRGIALGLALAGAAGTVLADASIVPPPCAATRTCDYEFTCSSEPCEQSKPLPHPASGMTLPSYSVDASAAANWLNANRVDHLPPFLDPGVVESLLYRVDDTLTLTGRLGGGYRRAHRDFGGAGTFGKKGLGTVFGVGVSYALTDRWTLNADVDRASASRRIGGKPITTFSISAEYRF